MPRINQLNTPLKIGLLLLTAWPFFYIPLFFVMIFSMLFGSQTTGGIPPEVITIFSLHLFTIISGFFLMFYYIFDAYNNKLIQGDKKTIWIVIIFLGANLAMIVYWYIYGWKKKKITKNK